MPASRKVTGPAGRAKRYNSSAHLEEKVWLRCHAVQLVNPSPRVVHVMDAFAGDGTLWAEVRRRMEPDGWKFHIFSVDRDEYANTTLRSDNVQVLASLDLSGFDIVDLDAYGWPVEQLRIVSAAPRRPLTVVSRIAATLGWSGAPAAIMADLGVNPPKDTPANFLGAVADEMWDGWLYELGWRVSLRFLFNKQGSSKCYELLLPTVAT